MKKATQDKILQQAIEKYGVPAQIDMLMEECAELIAEVNHYKRDRVTCFSSLLSKIADVEIMLRQMRMIFNYYSIDELIDYKIHRLKKRLNGENTDI